MNVPRYGGSWTEASGGHWSWNCEEKLGSGADWWLCDRWRRGGYRQLRTWSVCMCVRGGESGLWDFLASRTCAKSKWLVVETISTLLQEEPSLGFT